jgi:nitroreductase
MTAGAIRPDVVEVIRSRRSVRRFTTEPVSREAVELILEAGLSAPSSKNSQPWFIAVASGRAKLDVCRWVDENAEGVDTRPGDMLIDEPQARPQDSTAQSLEYVRGAPVLLLVFNRAPFTGGRENIDTAIRNGDRVNFENEYVGIGACMQNMLLTAHALGLGAVAVMDLLPAGPEIRRAYGIEHDLVLGIAVGHPEHRLAARAVEPARFVRVLD